MMTFFRVRRPPLSARSALAYGSLLWVGSACSGPAFSEGDASASSRGGSASTEPSAGAAAASPRGGAGGSSPAGSGGVAGVVNDSRPEPTAGAANDIPEPIAAGGNSDAGEGGEGGVGPSCPEAATGALQVFVSHDQEDPLAPGDHASSEIHPFLLVVNGGTTSVPLTRLKVRYFFSAEVMGPWQTGYFWATELNGAPFDSSKGFAPGPTLQVRSGSSNRSGGDHYLELSFVSGENVTLPAGKFLEVRAWIKVDPGRGQLVQSDDWSFTPSGTGQKMIEGFRYRESTHVVAYIDDRRVWGAEPCP